MALQGRLLAKIRILVMDTDKFYQEVQKNTVERIDIMERNIQRVLELMVSDLRTKIESHQKEIDELQLRTNERAKQLKDISDEELERINTKFTVTKRSLTEIREHMSGMLTKNNHEKGEASILSRLQSLEYDIKELEGLKNQSIGRNAVWAIVISTMINLAFVLLKYFIK